MDSVENLVRKAVDQGTLPRYLYKYRETERTKQILGSREFWFANSSSFNDPFDTNLSVDRSFRVPELKRYMKGLGFSGAKLSDWLKQVKKNPDVFNRLDVLTSNQVKQSLGTLSLSKTYKDLLMWSHYADEHKGQVIELDVLKDLDFFSVSVQILYQNSYTPLEYLKDSEESAMRNLSIKAKAWEYEKEIRIVKKFVGLCSIKDLAITKIYFGCNSTVQDKNDIIELCQRQNLSNIKFYEAFKKYGKFELQFSRLT